MELIIRNALLRSKKNTVDIGINLGKIEKMENNISEVGIKEIDAEGNLVIPAFIDPHIHLDKILLNEVVRNNVSGTLTEAIEILREKKKTYTLEDIESRAGRIIEQVVVNGTLNMRTHVDVDTVGGLKPLKALLNVRKKYADLMDLQIVAFPQEGIIKDEGCESLMWQAMELGADIVGGMPASENTPADSLKHVQVCFEIAEEFDVDIDMHVDESDDPFYRTLEMIADEVIKRKFKGRVTAGHTCALAAYDDHYANYVMDKVKEAGIHMITNPVTNLMLQGRNDKQPIRRGITRVKELIERDINVAFGQDCIKDTFYPFGRGDMLEVAIILAHAAQMSLPDEIKMVFNMPLENSAKIMGLKDYGIKIGNQADIVVLAAISESEALRLNADRRFVIRKGKVVAQTEKKVIKYF